MNPLNNFVEVWKKPASIPEPNVGEVDPEPDESDARKDNLPEHGENGCWSGDRIECAGCCNNTIYVQYLVMGRFVQSAVWKRMLML